MCRSCQRGPQVQVSHPARATVRDGPEGVRADIRLTRASAVLITPGRPPAQLTKLINLPPMSE